MRRSQTIFARFSGLCLALLLLGSCGRSPTVRYYRLPSLADQPGDRGATPGRSSMAVIVGPISLPRFLARPYLVWRSGATRLDYDELHRWGASLESEVLRALSENLSVRLGARQVVMHPADDPTGQAFRVAIDIERFDAVPGRATRLRARWIVRRGTDPAAAPLAVDSVDLEAPLKSSAPSAVVASYGAAIEQLSARIAEGLKALSP